MKKLVFRHTFTHEKMQPYTLTITFDLSDASFVDITSNDETMHAFVRDFFPEEYALWMEEMFPIVREHMTPEQEDLMCDGDRWQQEKERRSA